MSWGRVVCATVVVGLCSLGGCTGGNMGNTRGGGAAPGQSGGRDTTGAGVVTSTPSSAAPTAGTTDTSKRGQRTPTKRP
jgi:hypothetical protein